MTDLRSTLAGLFLGALLGATAAAAQGTAPPAPAGPLGVANLGRLTRSAGTLPPGRALALKLEGTLELEGHYSRPHETHLFRSLRRIVVASSGEARQDWTTWAPDDSAGSTETTLLLGERVFQRAASDTQYVELAGREAFQAAFEIRSSVPVLSVMRALSVNGRGLAGGPVSAYQSMYSWTDSLGRTEYSLDGYDRPWSYSTVRTDPRRGTLVEDSHYYGTSEKAGCVWPDSLRLQMCLPDVMWFLTEHGAGVEEDVSLAELAAPATFRPAAAPPDTTPRVTAVAAGIWGVELPDADSRSLVAEFADHVVLLETAGDVLQGERLRGAIRAKFPNKPIRFVAVSHYHPAYTGGLRPFLADSAEVVCTGDIGAYVNEIAHQNFSMGPDRWWRLRPGGAAPRMDTLTIAGRWRHADPTNELVAIDIGAKSHHTDRYLVFWFPRQRVLFEADLGFFSRGGEVRASRRAAGLLEAVDEAKLAPQTVVQSWPVKGNPASLPFAKLRELAASSKP